MIQPSAPSTERPPLQLVQKTCVYCYTASGPGVRLVADGPGAWCCADDKACERRIKDEQLAAPAVDVPTYSGPISVGAISFPLDAALGRYLVFGKSGAGKTNGDTVFAEEYLSNSVPTVILDYLGNMWGLRSSADGLAPGFPIAIIGGRFGDLPLFHGSGPALAEIVGRGVSAILDMSRLPKDSQQDFTADFLEALGRAAVVPMHVIVEEAETIAPARATSPAHFRASTVASAFARQCRNGSIGWTFSTQRVDHIAHDIRNSHSALVAMQNSDEDEQRSIAGQVASRVGKAKARRILGTLATLKRGEAWLLTDSAWLGDDDAEAPPMRFRFRLRATFDSARPTKIGEVRQLPSVRAEVDLSPFEGLLRDVDALTTKRPVDVVPEPVDVPPSGPSPEVRRGILLELLRRLPQERTSKPILAALTGLSASAFEEGLRSLVDDEYVDTRRGHGGGVALTPDGFEHLGIPLPKDSSSSARSRAAREREPRSRAGVAAPGTRRLGRSRA